MDDSERAHAQSLRDQRCALFIAQHRITIPRFRRDAFRPLAPSSTHPLYGTLGEGITDGITAWALTLDGRLVHVAFGQLDLPVQHYAGPRRSRNASQTSKLSPTKPKPTKRATRLDPTDLY